MEREPWLLPWVPEHFWALEPGWAVSARAGDGIGLGAAGASPGSAGRLLSPLKLPCPSPKGKEELKLACPKYSLVLSKE